MNKADRIRWFTQQYGRPPIDDYDLECGMFRSSWTQDPATREHARRVVEYAQEQGGDVLEFAKMHWRHYWGLEMPLTLEDTIEEMGITEDRAQELLTQISDATREPAARKEA